MSAAIHGGRRPDGGGSAEVRSDGGHEPWLVLFAAPLLLLAERLPAWAPPIGLAWIAMLWFARRARLGHWSAATVLDAPVLALLCTLPGAVLVAGDAGAALSRAYSLVFAIGMAYAVANGVATARRAWMGATWIMLAGLALSALGLVSVDWLVKYPSLETVLARLPSLLDSIPHATLGAVEGTPDVGVHPNNLAGLLVLFVPLAAACALPGGWFGRGSWRSARRSSGSSRRDVADRRSSDPALAPPPIVRTVAITTLAVTLPVLVLTQSRGAWLGLAVSLAALMGVWARGSISAPSGLRRHGGVIGGVLASVAVLGVLLVFTIVGMQSDRPDLLPETTGGAWYSPSAAGRLRLWLDGLEMLRQAPLTGIGLHNFPLVHGYLPEYDAFVYKGFAHVHNQLLQAALDFGLPGLVAVVGLMTSVGWGVRRIRRHTSGGAFDPLVVGLALGLLAHVIHGLVDAVAIGAKPGFIPWAFVGLIAAIRLRVHRWSPEPERVDNAREDLVADRADRIIGASAPDAAAPPSDASDGVENST